MDPKLVLNSAFNAIKQALANKKIDNLHIAVSSFGESFVCLDENDEPLFNIILCSDTRGEKQLGTLLECVNKEGIMKMTGIPAHPMYSIIKLMWLKENQPDLFKKTKKILLIADYIIYMLTGETVTDFSLASRTMLFNPVKKEWEKCMFNAVGIDEKLFPETVVSGTLVSKVAQSMAMKLGLPKNTYIVMGAHDQSCATLGAGIINSGTLLCGMGTAMCISATYDEPILTSSMMENNYNCGVHVCPNKYLSLAFTFSGGSLVSWFAENLAFSFKNNVLGKDKSFYKYLDSIAYSKPSEILVFPHFSGSGTPKMDTNARGLIWGLTLSTKINHLYRAVLEGIIYEMRYNLEQLKKSGVHFDTVRAVGDGAKSKLWLQIMADILECNIETMKYNEAGILGGAICASIAGGIFKDFREAVNSLVHTDKLYMPDRENAKIYNRQFEKYKNIYQEKGFEI